MARLMLGRGGVIGVDVGSSATKVVYGELTGDGIIVRTAFSFETPAGAVRDGVVAEPLDVAERIREKLGGYTVPTKTAIASISGATVTVRPVRVPVMAEHLLRKSIRYEAARHITTSLEESALEFEIVDPDAGNGEMEVLLVAAPEAMVNSMVQTIEAAGLEAVAVDLDAFALYRSLVESNDGFKGEGKTLVMLELGASHTDLQIVNSGKFVLSRTLPICGDSLTRAVEPLTSGDRERAEALKREIDLAAGRPVEGGSEPPQIRAARAIVPLLEDMVREIKRSMQYYAQTDAAEGREQAQIDHVILGGGGARLAGLAEFLTAKLETPVSVGNPLDSRPLMADPDMLNLEQILREEGPVYAVSLGLALKEHPIFAPVKRTVRVRTRPEPEPEGGEAELAAEDQLAPEESKDEAAA